MLWRLWTLVASAPVGVLAGLAIREAPTAYSLQLSAALGGLVGVAMASLAARHAPWLAERGWHLARASSAGLAALPAIALVLLGLFPGPQVLLAVVIALWGLALLRATRASGPPASLAGHAVAVVLLLLAFPAAVVAAAGLRAALVRGPHLDDSFAAAVYDLDASVAPRPRARCEPRAERVEVLAEIGAHPGLDAAGELLWFDAADADGRRQVHRLELASGEIRCWTCEEPGNNRRPAPSPVATAVVFDTDRHATWRHPANTELHLITGRGDARPAFASRRLTFDPEPDDHAVYDPTGRGLLWSRGSAGGYQIVRAALHSGHGGLLLGPAQLLASGGPSWIAPLAWSADARGLAKGHGHWLGGLDGRLLDPATGDVRSLGRDLAGPRAVSFSADGTRMAVAASNGGGVLRLPRSLGFLLGRLRPMLNGTPPPPTGATTVIRLGDTHGELEPVDLGDAAVWGAPSGISLQADARAFVLGQRRAGEGGLEERLIRVELDCEAPAS